MKAMNLKALISQAQATMMSEGKVVHTERWQATKIDQERNARMVEVLHLQLKANIVSDNLEYLQRQTTPNLPWAEDHFKERVCGQPINPGKEWANWPWAKSADGHRDGDMFNHNYMERYWPRYAGLVAEPTIEPEDYTNKLTANGLHYPRVAFGIRGEWGDLEDLIQTLVIEPDTRQAYLPIWFPEDTAVSNRGRKPCTLGYHFIIRDNMLDIRYDIRSCDLARHFNDDVYMTVRLAAYVLAECKKRRADAFQNVKLGTFVMNITSLHMFIGDYQKMFKRNPETK